jgi:hypothetical protein
MYWLILTFFFLKTLTNIKQFGGCVCNLRVLQKAYTSKRVEKKTQPLGSPIKLKKGQ